VELASHRSDVTAADYLLGAVALAMIVGPVLAASTVLCARWVPAWNGAQRVLAVAITFVAAVILVAQVLGSVGLFRRWPMVAACTALGLGVWMWQRRSPPPVNAGPALDDEPPRASKPLVVASAVVSAVVVARWLVATVISFRSGMSEIDSLNYHGSFAVRFLQTGWVTGLDYNSGNAIFYPANGELGHAIALLPFHQDLLLPLVNLGWLALALLAGWCAGRPFGVAAVTLAGTALVTSSPLLIANNGGTAGNDVATLALILSVVAILLREPRRPAELALAAAAAGLAMGTKLNVLAPLVLLILVLVVVVRRERRTGSSLRRAQMLALLVPAVGLSSLWYIRNLIVASNPLPMLRLGIGPVAFPQVGHPDPGQQMGVPLYRYGLHVEHWAELRAGVVFGLGWAGPLMLVLALAGLGAAVMLGSNLRQRVLAGFGVVLVLTYVANPLSAGGFRGDGGFFGVNLRYLVPALAAGIILLAVQPIFVRARSAIMGLCALGVVISIAGPESTSSVNRVVPPGMVALGAAVVVGLVIGLLVVHPVGSATGRPRRRWWGAAAVLSVSVLGVGWPMQREAARTRYLQPTSSANLADRSGYRSDMAAYRWARPRSHRRIAVDGSAVYGLYGADLSNTVEVVLRRLGRGDTVAIDDCRSWRRALASGRYDDVVIFSSDFGPPDSLAWTRTITGIRSVTRDDRSEVFRLPSRITPAGCPVR
jgi:hypothetical protein